KEPEKRVVSTLGHSDPEKPPEPVDCVFLWQTTSCREALRRAASRSVRLHAASSFDGAVDLLSQTASRVLLVEAASQEPHWLRRVSDVDSLRDTALWIAVLTQFDGGRWIEMLERGAFDVICAPFRAGDLRRVVLNAHSRAGTQNLSLSASYNQKT